MGSGAFLVQTCRYLGEKLVEAWDNAETAHPGKVVITPEGTLSSKSSSKLSLQSSLESPLQQSIIPQEADERLIVARRIIADRCLYGVDKNPLAVEMAKLSLWLITLQKNRPFTFLDHALKCGDSLIGVGIEQLGYWNLNVRKTAEIFANEIRYEVDKIIKLRKEIIQLPVLTSQDQNRKEYLLARVKANSLDLVQRCNLLVGSYLNNWHEKEQEGLRQTLLINIREGTDIPQEKAMALPDFEKLRPFHWELEFPEVFIDHSVSLFANASSTKKNQSANYSQGFDAIVGNPPFMGGKKITGNVGTEYRDFLVKWLANGKKGSADLCAYFFLRAKHLLQPNGVLGMIATNTIAQGDTREVGLDQLIADCTIYRAVPSRTWPGTASLEVAYVWLKKGGWKGNFILDEKPVGGITAFLTVPGKVFGNPERLVANQNKSFQGSIVLGMGFVLTPEEAEALIEKDPRNKDVLFPYLNGEDLNTSPDQSPSRWVINFRDWPLDAEHDINPKNPQGAPYASNYPDCLAIVREKVKPERDKLSFKTDSSAKGYAKYWWIYGRRSIELYRAIANMERVLFHGFTSKYVNFAFVRTENIVYAGPHVVIALDKYQSFCLLQSTIHIEWVNHNSSTMKKDVRYSPTDCFETFPFPTSIKELEEIGEKYYNHRQKIMSNCQQGLTKTYNRFHLPEETTSDIKELRNLHIEMDKKVATAYGWQDIELDHDFHVTKQGIRFTICENARREILDRLLKLNHQIYEEEVAKGLHHKGNKKAKTGGKEKVKENVNNDIQQMDLFGEQ